MDGCMPVTAQVWGQIGWMFWHCLSALPALCRGKCLVVGTSSGLRSAPACGNSQIAELGLDSFQNFLLRGACWFMDASIVCDPDPQHSHGLQMVSGVEDNRRAKRDYLNGTGMVVLVPHHVNKFFEFGVDKPIFRRGVWLATHFDAIYVEIKAGVEPFER